MSDFLRLFSLIFSGEWQHLVILCGLFFVVQLLLCLKIRGGKLKILKLIPSVFILLLILFVVILCLTQKYNVWGIGVPLDGFALPLAFFYALGFIPIVLAWMLAGRIRKGIAKSEQVPEGAN